MDHFIYTSFHSTSVLVTIEDADFVSSTDSINFFFLSWGLYKSGLLLFRNQTVTLKDLYIQVVYIPPWSILSGCLKKKTKNQSKINLFSKSIKFIIFLEFKFI